MKNYVKIWVWIILSMLSVWFAWYALLKWDISFDDFRATTNQESQNIDENLWEIFE